MYPLVIFAFVVINVGASWGLLPLKVPSVPDVKVPSVPDVKEPSVPDATLPTVPKATVPLVPDATAPSIPDINKPPGIVPPVNLPSPVDTIVGDVIGVLGNNT